MNAARDDRASRVREIRQNRRARDGWAMACARADLAYGPASVRAQIRQALAVARHVRTARPYGWRAIVAERLAVAGFLTRCQASAEDWPRGA